MEKKYIECYTLDELNEEARKRALDDLLDTGVDFISLIAQDAAHKAVSNVLAAHGLELQDGPYYQLEGKGQYFSLAAVWQGGGTNPIAKTVDAHLDMHGLEASAIISLEHRCCRRSKPVIDVEVWPADEDEDVESRAIETAQDELEYLLRKALEDAEKATRDKWEYHFSEEYLESFAEKNNVLFTENGKLCPVQ